MPLHSGRILVVDDEEPAREIISSMLSAAGYQTRQAASGLEALAILATAGEFELVLTDLMMGELDGIALLERSKEKYPDMPLIIFTAVHDISVALAAIRNGAYDYLLKPFEREQLLAIVRRALEHRRLKLENRVYQMNLESLVAARTDQLRQALTDLERSYDIVMEALGDVMDLRDTLPEDHSKLVTSFSIAIARAMGVPGERIRVIARGVFLHDIGSMAVPEAILRKAGPLTPEETSVLHEHCFRGYQMLRKIPFLKEAAEIVYAHQERYDGKGYPQGLQGDAIPLGARIFAVADALASMTAHRPSQKAQSISAAKEEIRRGSGTQFDPTVVNVFLQMPDRIWEDLRQEIESNAYRFVRPAATQPKEDKPGLLQ